MTREEAIQVLKNTAWLGSNEDREATEEAIDMAIEALKDRPQGEWIAHTTAVGDKEYIEYSHCSECGEIAFVHMNFCPNCGSDNRGDNNG